MSIKRANFEYVIDKAITSAIVHYTSNNTFSQDQMNDLIEEAWQRLNQESPESLQRERVAVVLDDATSVEHVQNYLPVGYSAKIEFLPGNQAGKTGNAMRIVIRGYDFCGWTLDDYVIPRLASGLIVATEVYTEACDHNQASDFEANQFLNGDLDHDED